jgi:hypothetical protein
MVEVVRSNIADLEGADSLSKDEFALHIVGLKNNLLSILNISKKRGYCLTVFSKLGKTLRTYQQISGASIR